MNVSDTPEMLSDGEIIERVLAGERQLFELLVTRHGRRVFRTAMSVLRNTSDAEEVMQESFVRSYVHLDRLQDRACFLGWITRIASNQALRLATRGSKDLVNDFEAVAGADNPEHNVIREDRARRLRVAVSRLPRAYRDVIVLRDFKEVETHAAARSLRLTVSNLKVRLHRAHLMLKRELMREDAARTKAA